MRAPIPGGPGWQMNGDTLRAEVTDINVFLAAHADDPVLDVVVALFQSEPGLAGSCRGLGGHETLATQTEH